MAEQAQLEALRDRCLDRFGRVDIVMNNVGVIALGPPESLPVEAWSRVLDLNVLGIARSNVVFLPLLLEQGRGHVVNTSSASGLLAYGYDRLPYVASKHAVVGISEALAVYLGPKGIGVTCACPSGVMTNISEQITAFGESSSPRAPQHRARRSRLRGGADRRRDPARPLSRRHRPGDPRRAPRTGRRPRHIRATADREQLA